MNKLQKTGQGLSSFLAEVTAEAKRCTWPEKQTLIESTIAIIVLVTGLSIFVGLSDQLLINLLRLLIPSG